MNNMDNFMINKSTKDIGREIINTAIYGNNNNKKKENQMDRHQGSAPG